jgi:hypothetical protein
MTKKGYLTFAGILSAIILSGMFLVIIVTAFFPALFLPAIAIDPVTGASTDAHNRLVLTGTTSLPDLNQIHLNIIRRSLEPVQGAGLPVTNVRGFARLLSDTGDRNPWKGYADISSLEPGDYLITFVKVTYSENFTKRTESEPLATLPFTIGDEASGQGSIRKKPVTDIPFIRINTPDANASGEISGITSLGPEYSISWTVNRTEPGTGTVSLVKEGIADIVPGMDGINRWSITPDAGIVKPGKYQVTVTGRARDMAHTVLNGSDPVATQEVLFTSPYSTEFPPGGEYIAIDALPVIQTDGVYTLSGTTSLPPGEELLVEVLPYVSGAGIDLIIDPRSQTQKSGVFSSVTGMVSVSEGGLGQNLWTFELETYLLAPGPYIVTINNTGHILTNMTEIHGGLSCSRVFTITERLS